MKDLLFPELTRGVAQERLAEVRRTSLSGASGLRRIASLRHPKAFWPPTGGRAAQETDIRGVVQAVEGAVTEWQRTARRGEDGNRDFDLVLGRALHENLHISPAAASREGMWNFLTLIVFPEYLYARFPKMPEERAFGTHRNVLRRVWLRQEVLGTVIHRKEGGLREDEFVQILERTALVRTPALAQAVAREILSRPADGAREAFSRDLAKEVVRRTGPLLLDALSPDDLQKLVRDCAAQL